MKTLKNTTSNNASENVKDIQFWGDRDTWKLISKAWSDEELWMKSTKVMEIEGVGCVIQVTTQQGFIQGFNKMNKEPNEQGFLELSDEPVIEWNIAEAVTFIPGVKIKEIKNKEGKIISRKLIKL